MDDEHDDGYAGPATLTVNGQAVPVRAILDARHEPHDGRLHWFGRITPDDADAAHAVLHGAADAELSTAGGRAPARVGDLDPWGRYRVTGTGRPPFVLAEPALDD
jgi:hypothetical protein